MKVAVVGHVSREEQASRLASSLNARLFLDRLTLGATWNHLRALNWGSQYDEPLVVLEDDAEPVPGFLKLAEEAAERHPRDLLSLYLGTDSRRHQAEIDHTAETYPHRTLLHAVAYTIPGRDIAALRYSTRQVADEAIGRAWWAARQRPVLHLTTSLVEHADTLSVEQGGRRLPARKAWRLHEGVQPAWVPQPLRG